MDGLHADENFFLRGLEAPVCFVPPSHRRKSGGPTMSIYFYEGQGTCLNRARTTTPPHIRDRDTPSPGNPEKGASPGEGTSIPPRTKMRSRTFFTLARGDGSASHPRFNKTAGAYNAARRCLLPWWTALSTRSKQRLAQKAHLTSFIFGPFWIA